MPGSEGIIFHSFYSVCAIVPIVFFLTMAAILFTLKGRSASSLILGSFMISLSFYFLGWFISSAVYHPLAAWCRMLTIPGIFLSEILGIAFLFYYPYPLYTRLLRPLSVLVSFVAVFVLAWFLVSHGPVVFIADSHSFDFAPSYADKVTGYMIIALFQVFLLLGFVRTVKARGQQRWGVFSITVIMFASLMVPMVINLLYRYGLTDRGDFLAAQDVTNMIAYFAIVVIYLNTTTDGSSFMTKVIAISMASFLVIFQAVGYVSLRNQGYTFDKIKTLETSVMAQGGAVAPDCSFLVRYPVRSEASV
ncbi:MAG: hypothetical protein ACRCUT_12525, partial [Spirochaetota bacterium]